MLPSALKIKNGQYINDEDRIRNLLGKLLLLEALKTYGYNNFSLDSLLFTKFGKPYLSPDFDFSIAHSGQYVFCAFGQDTRLGIDVEGIVSLDFNHVTESMTNAEWGIINRNGHPLKMFYKFWTMKEATVKADGRGFHIHPKDVKIEDNIARIGSTIWYLDEIIFDSQYCAHIANIDSEGSFKTIYVDFEIKE